MSLEKQQVKTHGVFPISTPAAVDAYVWMKNNLESSSSNQTVPGILEDELAKLRTQQPNLFLFLDQMKHLRGSVMFSQSNKFSYDHGVLFMMRTFKNQFREAGKSFPTLSEPSLLGYFQNLIDVETNHPDIEKLKEIQGIDPNTPLLPYALANLALGTNIQTPAVQKVVETFTLNSEQAAYSLCDGEELGRDIMLQGETANRFGPIQGFVYGATDVYTVIKQFEEAKDLRRQFRIKTK